MAGDIFISYRREREADAGRLEQVLRAEGFADHQIFRDVSSLMSGESFDRQLTQTLSRTRVVLFLLGPGDAPTDRPGDWVTKELTEALNRRRPVVTLVVPGGAADIDVAWPPRLEVLKSTDHATLSRRVTGAEQRQLVQLLRRHGVRPQLRRREWNDLIRHHDLSPVVREIVEVAAAGGPGGTTLITGRPGSGRSHALLLAANELAERLGAPAPVAHRPLTDSSRAEGAAFYDWVSGIVGAGASPPDALFHLDPCGLSSRRISASLLDRLTSAQRFELVRVQQEAAAQLPADRDVITAAVRLLGEMAAARPLVVVCDDFDLLDCTSQELVCALGRHLHRHSEASRIALLVVTEADSIFVDPLRKRLGDCPVVRVADSCDAMLSHAQLEASLLAHISGIGLRAMPALSYLGNLCDEGLIVQRGGVWCPTRDIADLPTPGAMLDAELNSLIPPALQQMLEFGAMLGMRFPLVVADAVAAGHTDGLTNVAADLAYYDSDSVVVRFESGGNGSGEFDSTTDGQRVGFASSVWWHHLRDRRMSRPEPSAIRADVRSLAETMASFADGPAGRYSDWATVAFLYDAIGEKGLAGAAFLRAARLARLNVSRAAATRAYADAARCLEVHALRHASPGFERASELLRSAFCWLRSATVGRGHGDDAESTEALAAAVAAIDAVDAELDRPGQAEADIDLDAMLTAGADVRVERREHLRAQWRSLGAQIELERGGRCLAAAGLTTPAGPPDRRDEAGIAQTDSHRDLLDQAQRHFYTAIRRAETGLSGWVYQQLTIGASAGLAVTYAECVDEARAIMSETGTRSSETTRVSLLHGFQARMRFAHHGRHLADIGSLESVAIERLTQSVTLATAARRTVGERLGLAALADFHDDRLLEEEQLIELVNDMELAITDQARRGHGELIVGAALELVDEAADLERLRHDLSFVNDLRLCAHAHDLFRLVDGARLLRLWRDIRDPEEQNSDAEWHNPVLLHGRLAAKMLRHDLKADLIIGEPRFRRLEHALASHTVGAVDLKETAPNDAAFVRTFQLAEMRVKNLGDARIDEIWRQARELDGLATAYAQWFGHQSERLRRQGRFVSAATTVVSGEA